MVRLPYRLAIVSLTEQLIMEKIARDVYDDRARLLQSEVCAGRAHSGCLHAPRSYTSGVVRGQVTRLSLNDNTAEGVQTAATSDVRIRFVPDEYVALARACVLVAAD
jgi:hypothetical protein